jgi:hypothetical protein
MDGIGGTYFLRSVGKEVVAVFKPGDEEPFTPNNPKCVALWSLCGSRPRGSLVARGGAEATPGRRASSVSAPVCCPARATFARSLPTCWTTRYEHTHGWPTGTRIAHCRAAGICGRSADRVGGGPAQLASVASDWKASQRVAPQVAGWQRALSRRPAHTRSSSRNVKVGAFQQFVINDGMVSDIAPQSFAVRYISERIAGWRV